MRCLSQPWGWRRSRSGMPRASGTTSATSGGRSSHENRGDRGQIRAKGKPNMNTEQELPGVAPIAAAAMAHVPRAPGPRKDAAGRRHRSLGVAIVLDLVLVAIGLAAWQYAVDSDQAGGLLYGSPVAIGQALVSGVHSGELITNALTTAVEALLGFVV